MLFRVIIFLSLLSLIAACKEPNWVTLKDENAQISEKYKVNDQKQKDGLYQRFSDGILQEKAHYKADVLSGRRTLYFPDGKPEIEEYYEDGLIIGTYKAYYEDGTTLQEAHYISGMMQGPLKTYYKNGQLKELVTMVDNEENGPFKEYHENGQLKWEGRFLNGDNEFGLLKHYNDSGELIKKMECDSLGVCATIWTLEDGDVKSDK